VASLPFDYACRALIRTCRVTPYYELILIDEGEDFPDGFYELCFHLANGDRDEKQIVWAYDELQDVFDVKVRTPEELFGDDLDGQPRISLQRALPESAETNDFVLPKCYRNQRDVLLAHAIGFGLYGQPVQILQDRNHWEDVGYEVVSGDEALAQRVSAPTTSLLIDTANRRLQLRAKVRSAPSIVPKGMRQRSSDFGL
jgi:superfamily I DNA and RNA helicase